MKRPQICAVITDTAIDSVREIEPLADLFEVRIDLIGEGWQSVAKQLQKPWIGCNRSAVEGGKPQDEGKRLDGLLEAVELGADIIDIELGTKRVHTLIPVIKKTSKCLLSFHDLKGTPSIEEMKRMVEKQLHADADICKVVGTARDFNDNFATLQLIAAFPKNRLVSFCMGPEGMLSRVLCPLVGSQFIYASIGKGRESAPGQLTVRDLSAIYGMLK
ncbi:MAG: type I 3-dehydroquinate dehydratase [Chloroflexi bacterium]|nr:type I 3-dehydroquinate dehydratase [Chloroflexota bacterium]